MQNFTTNVSTELPLVLCPSLDSTASHIFQIIGHISVCMFALTGNLWIVANFIQKRISDRIVIDALITNMAISDLLVPLLIVSRELHDKLTNSKAWAVQGVTGEIICKLVSYFGDVASTVSIVSLCIITIDRFVMVVVADNVFQNQRERRNKRLNYILIAVSWIIPMMFYGHFFVTFKLVFVSTEIGTLCAGPVFKGNHLYYIYNITVCIVFIFVPFIILTTLNTAMVLKLRRLCRSLSAVGTQEYRKRLKGQRRIKNMIISIIVVFGLCWGPYFMIFILFTFYWNLIAPHTCTFHTLRFLAVFLTRANAAINPWVYLYFQRKKRVRFSFLNSFPLRPIRHRPRVVPRDDAPRL